MIEPDDFDLEPAPQQPEAPRITDDPFERPLDVSWDPDENVAKHSARLSLIAAAIDTVLSVLFWGAMFVPARVSSPLCPFLLLQPLFAYYGLKYGMRGLKGTRRVRTIAIWGIALSAANVIALLALIVYMMYGMTARH